jgi:ribosome-binding ATPase YchF (GTP1/OBG family)
MEILEILNTKDFKQIFNYKTRYYQNDKEDIKQELILRMLENKEKNWNIYNISNEINKIISKIKTNNKYISDKVTGQLNENEQNIDFQIEQYNNMNCENVNNYKFNKTFKTNYTMEFDDFNAVLVPIFKKILKLEEYLLFHYIYIDGEKISDIKTATKLPQVTLTYIHKNLKQKIKKYLLDNPDLLNEFLTN